MLVIYKLLLSSLIYARLDSGTAFNLVLVMELLTYSHFLFDVFSPLVEIELLDVLLENIFFLQLAIVNTIVKAPLAVDGPVLTELYCLLLTHFKLDVGKQFRSKFS